MPRLIDLPTEILLALPLSQADMASMTGVCDRFQDIFTPCLDNSMRVADTFKWIGWWFVPKVKICDHRASILPGSLSPTYSSLSSHVHELRFHPDPFDAVKPNEFVDSFSKILRAQPARPNTMFIISGPGKLDDLDIGRYPRLQKLIVSSAWGNRLNPQKVLPMAYHPLIRTIELHNECGWSNRTHILYPVNDPLADYAFRAAKGKELIINRTNLRVRDLGELVQAFSDLEAFTFIKDTSSCGYSDFGAFQDCGAPESCGGLRIKELDPLLQLHQTTLEKLVLIQGDSDQCDLNYTALESLTHFHKLRNIRIEAHYLLGYHESHAHPPIYTFTEPRENEDIYRPEIAFRPLRSLSTLLPATIERLELHIRPVELLHDPEYCTEIIHGLIDDIDSLRSLRHIVLEETQYQNYLASSQRKQQTPVIEDIVRDMQRICTAFGIRMTYIKRGWPITTHVDMGSPYLDQEAPFHVIVYEPGAEAKKSDFRWRTTTHFLGTTVSNLDVEPESVDSSIDDGLMDDACKDWK